MPAVLDTGIGAIAIAVLATLLLMSVASGTIAIDRAFALRRAVGDSRRFARTVQPLIRKGDWTGAEGAIRQARQAPLARVVAAGLAEWSAWPADDGDRALGAAREAAAFAAEMSLTEMRRGLTALATIGSTAPFVGLFGTTFGIIHAFAAMGATGSAAMNEISAGISEALVTTAFGLFVAIPAVWAYNAFLGWVEVLRVELERGRFVLIEQLARRA
jgi:biopolymer transport protein ExbB/biopolymer transport protein TolQ